MEYLLILMVAFIAGIDGILDEFQFHQPLVSCTLIGLFTNHLQEGLILGGSLQLIALGWANIGAAVAPDVCLASIISSIFMIKGLNSGIDSRYIIAFSIAIAIPLSLVGLSLTKFCRNYANTLAHKMDETLNVSKYQRIGICMQGLRVLLPACILCLIPSSLFVSLYSMIPEVIYHGLIIGSGVVCVVGFAIVSNVLSSKQSWAFFFVGFGLACIQGLSIIGLCMIGAGLMWLVISQEKETVSSTKSDDPLGDILNDY